MYDDKARNGKNGKIAKWENGNDKVVKWEGSFSFFPIF